MRAHPLLLTLLVCLLLLTVVGALDGLRQYARVYSEVMDGARHIHTAWALLDTFDQPLVQTSQAPDASHTPGRPLPPRPLDASTLDRIDAELGAAAADFAALHAQLASPSGVVLVGTYAPRLAGRIASAATLAAAADEACQAGQALVAGARTLLDLSSSGYIDATRRLTRSGKASSRASALLAQLDASLAQAGAHLDAAVADARSSDLSVLPGSLATSAQRAALGSWLANWPSSQSRLAAAGAWQTLAGVVLGGARLDSLFLLG
jgi:hypothetical protein